MSPTRCFKIWKCRHWKCQIQPSLHAGAFDQADLSNTRKIRKECRFRQISPVITPKDRNRRGCELHSVIEGSTKKSFETHEGWKMTNQLVYHLPREAHLLLLFFGLRVCRRDKPILQPQWLQEYLQRGQNREFPFGPGRNKTEIRPIHGFGEPQPLRWG